MTLSCGFRDAANGFHNSIFASSSEVLEGFLFFCTGGVYALSRDVQEASVSPVTSINSIWLKCSHVEQYMSQEPEPETFELSSLDFFLLYTVCRLCHSRFMSSLLNFPWSFSTSSSNKESLKFRSRYSVRCWFHRAGLKLKKSIDFFKKCFSILQIKFHFLLSFLELFF